jgi:hypothetical protein
MARAPTYIDAHQAARLRAAKKAAPNAALSVARDNTVKVSLTRHTTPLDNLELANFK